MSNQDQINETSDDQIVVGELLNALMAMKKGNFSYRMPYDRTGMAGKVADTFNEIMDIQEALVSEVQTVAKVVGKEGIFREGLCRRIWVDHGKQLQIR